MKPNAARFRDALEQLLPFLIVVGVVVIAFFWFIQRPLNTYLQNRATAAQLQARLRTLEDATSRTGAPPATDLQAAIGEFEKQMSQDDKVADVTAILAKAVLDSAPADKLREFSIKTGERVAGTGQESRPAPMIGRAVGPDLRLSLFPVPVSFTPVTVSFASTFDAVAEVLWKVRNLPTTVEVRSATLTRGLPLMKLDLVVWVYQRGTAATPSGPATPSAPAQPASPTAPRVAQLSAAEGW